MKKPKKAAAKSPKNRPADDVTEQIVQLIAGSIASLPESERLAAMQEFDKAAAALSARDKKTARHRKKS